MAEAIMYCDECGRMITPREMSRGEAIITPTTMVCSACAGDLSPEQRAVLLGPPGQTPSPPRRAKKKRRATSAVTPRPPGGGPRPSPLPRGRRPRAPARATAAVSRQTGPADLPEFEPEPEKPKTGRYVMAGLVVLLMAGVAAFMIMPQEGKDDGKAASGGVPTVADLPRAGAAEPGVQSGTGGAGRKLPGGERKAAADAAARKAHLDRIRRLADKFTAGSSSSGYREIRREFASFQKSFPNDREAEALRAQVDEAHGRLADKALKSAAELARRLAASGFKEQAVSRVRSVAERFGESPWYDTRGREAVEKALGELDPGAVAAAAEGDGETTRRERAPKTTASSTNVVTNSAFEILDEKGMPVDWSLPPGAALLSEGGNHFVRLEQTRSARESIFLTGRFKLGPRWKTIHVSCRMRARTLRTSMRGIDKAMCLIAFEDGKGKQLEAVPEVSPFLKKSSDWVQLDGKTTVPDGAEYVVLKPGLYRSLGTLDVDDISVGPSRAPRLASRGSAAADRPGAARDTRKVTLRAPEGPSGEADLRRARAALRGGEFAGARAALEKRETWRKSDLSLAENLLEQIDEAEEAATERASARQNPYAKFLMELREVVRKGGISEAKAVFRRERAGLPAEYSERANHLSKRISAADLVEALVVDGLAAQKRPVRLDDVSGNRIAGRVQGVEDGVIRIKPTVGKVKEVRLVDVPPEELVRAAKLLRHGTVTKFQLASFAFVLGDMDAAGKWVAEADGEGVKALYDDIKLLKAALSPEAPAVAEEGPEEGAKEGMEEAGGEAVSPAGGVVDADVYARADAYFADVPKGGVEGVHLTRAAVINLARRYDGSRVSAKKLAAVGGAVAANTLFNASLKKQLSPGAGYRFASTSGVAGRGKTTGAVRKSIGKYLDREKPEFVRVCFDATDLAKGRSVKDLRSDLTEITQEILDHGALPVLLTLPILPPTEAEGRKTVTSYNDMVTKLATKLNVPCVNAWTILNTDLDSRRKYFRGPGALTRSGYGRVNSAVFFVYRVLEHLVAGRDVPMPVTGRPGGVAGEGGEEEEPPPAGNLIVNGGFEQVAGGMPKGWVKHNWGAAGQILVRSDSTEIHGGKCSLQMRGVGRGVQAGAFTTVTLPKGAYEVRFWATTEVDETVAVHVRHGGTVLAPSMVTGEWSECKERFNVLQKETNVSFGLYAATPGRRVWIDDIALEYVGR